MSDEVVLPVPVWNKIDDVSPELIFYVAQHRTFVDGDDDDDDDENGNHLDDAAFLEQMEAKLSSSNASFPYICVTADVTDANMVRTFETIRKNAHLCVRLQAIELESGLSDEQVIRGLIELLKCTPNVQQVRFAVHTISYFAELFDALSTLRLLSFNMNWLIHPVMSFDLDAVWSKFSRAASKSIISLNVAAAPTTLPFLHSFCRNLHLFEKLRDISILGEFSCSEFAQFCSALTKCRNLRELRIIASCTDSLQYLTSYLLSPLQQLKPLEKLELFSVEVSDKAVITALLSAISRTTRLRHLHIHAQLMNPADFESSEIFESGWLTHVLIGSYSTPRAWAQTILKRNHARYDACKRACVSLIHARAKKRCLVAVPKDVVIEITRWLWDTRDQSVWDGK